jgi:hypothetical protein
MKTIISWCPGQTPPAHCDPCKPPSQGCVIAPDAKYMGEIICYALSYGYGDYRSEGCGYRDTNLVTGEVTLQFGLATWPPSLPNVSTGETLIISSTLSWSTTIGGPGGPEGQVYFPDVYYTGIGNPTVDTAGANQALDQVTATLDTAACVQPWYPYAVASLDGYQLVTWSDYGRPFFQPTTHVFWQATVYSGTNPNLPANVGLPAPAAPSWYPFPYRVYDIKTIYEGSATIHHPDGTITTASYSQTVQSNADGSVPDNTAGQAIVDWASNLPHP